MCHHVDANTELEVSDRDVSEHEDELESVTREELESELDREKFVALGLIT